MATATKVTPKPVKQPPAKIIVELSEGEADFILGILDSIDGSPINSPRKYAARIQEALGDALGMRTRDTDAYKLIGGAFGACFDSIYFRDYGTPRPLISALSDFTSKGKELSVIGSASGPPAFNFKNLGDSVAGVIVSFEDYQVTEYTDDPKRGVKKGDLKFFEKTGDPIMGCRIVLETIPEDSSSQVTLYVEKPRMLKSIAAAMRATGAPDLEAGADLAVTWIGMDGRAMAWGSAYARPEAEAVAA